MEEHDNVAYSYQIGTIGPEGIVAKHPIDRETYERMRVLFAELRKRLDPHTYWLLGRSYRAYRTVFDEAANSEPGLLVDGSSIFREITAELLNLLANVRLFLDHTDHELARRFGADSPEREAFIQACSREYDEHFAYRFLYRLRNYTQHRGLPIGRTTLSAHLEADANGNENVVRDFQLKFDRDRLLDEHDSWSTVRADLGRMPDEFEVDELVNQLMECLRRIAAVVVGADVRRQLDRIAWVDEILGPIRASMGDDLRLMRLRLDRSADDGELHMTNVEAGPIPLDLMDRVKRAVEELRSGGS